MTERGRRALDRSERRLALGPSSVHWRDGALVIEVDEWAAPPIPGRVRGTITLTPAALTETVLDLTPDGAHRWRPFAPTADISVDLDAPGWRWEGHGYFDANFGTRALEADFDGWTWARYLRPSGGTLCIYDATLRDGSRRTTALAFDPDGTAEERPPPPDASLPRTLWRLDRTTGADPGARPRQVKSLLDAPFYSRSIVETRIDGEDVTGVHEALDLTRFRRPVVKAMLACRIPRRPRWTRPGG